MRPLLIAPSILAADFGRLAEDVAFLVTGPAKREILARVRVGATDAPPARLRPVGRLHWFADRAAAG